MLFPFTLHVWKKAPTLSSCAFDESFFLSMYILILLIMIASGRNPFVSRSRYSSRAIIT